MRFKEFLDESSRKLSKLWAGKGGEFYDKSMK